LEEHAAVGVIERQQGFAEKREAEDAIDLHAEVSGESAAVVDEREDIVEAGLAEFELAQCRGGQFSGLAVG
jgi:hypothetical protein